MLGNVKALVVVLAFALVAFHVCRPLCLQYMRESTFARRRNVWLALTLAAFLSPSFWIYALIALPLMLWAGARDDNPLALFALLSFVIPDMRFYVSLPGINQLLDLSQHRLLAIAVLLPALLRDADPWRQRAAPVRTGGAAGYWRIEHGVLAAFLLLQAALLVPHETATTSLRRLTLGFLDAWIVVFAFARLVRREQIADAMCAFWLACALMAPIAVFESLKGWLLYPGIGELWGDPNQFAWLFRGSSLRAQAAAGHSINLGYQLAMGLGCYLYLRRQKSSAASDAAILGTFAAAIVVTYSRGAWLTALLVGLFYVALQPQAARRLAALGVAGAVAFAVMSATPLHDRIIDQLPFIGSASQDTIAYRQELAKTSWQLIQLNPLFGDPFVHLQMEHLRQGQGIIDFVNGYLVTALYNGLVGLGLFVAALLIPLARALFAQIRQRRHDGELGAMGGSLVACLLATLAFIATAGYGPTTFWLCGALASFAAVAAANGTATAEAPPAIDVADGPRASAAGA